MEISLGYALSHAAPYLPYVAAAATVTAIALIYFYIQKSNNKPQPRPPEPGPVRPPTPQPAPKQCPKEAFEAEASILDNHRLPKVTQGELYTLFQKHLEKARNPEELTALIKAFIEQTYRSFGDNIDRSKLTTRLAPFLANSLKAIWSHPQADVVALRAALEAFPKAIEHGIQALAESFAHEGKLIPKRALADRLKALNIEGEWDEECKFVEIHQLNTHFTNALTFDEKFQCHQRLEALDANGTDRREALLTTAAMKAAQYGYQPTNTAFQEALNLYRALTELICRPQINVQDLEVRVPPDLFQQDLILSIKAASGDADKNRLIHSHTAEIKDRYQEHFKLAPLKEAFTTLTIKIDDQAGHTFNLGLQGEMDRIIKAALWIDLLSLGADMGHRDLRTEMDQSSDETLAAFAAGRFPPR